MERKARACPPQSLCTPPPNPIPISFIQLYIATLDVVHSQDRPYKWPLTWTAKAAQSPGSLPPRSRQLVQWREYSCSSLGAIFRRPRHPHSKTPGDNRQGTRRTSQGPRRLNRKSSDLRSQFTPRHQETWSWWQVQYPPGTWRGTF